MNNKKRPGCETTGLNFKKVESSMLQSKSIKNNRFLKLIKKAYPDYNNKEVSKINDLHNQFLIHFNYSIQEIEQRLEKRAEIEEGRLKCL